jgi:hypothetical protein
MQHYPFPHLALGSETPFAVNIAIFCNVVVIILMGLNLVPSLLFEEKQAPTMGALLVSPTTAFLIGAIFVNQVNLELPAISSAIVPWIPSVSLFELIRLAFLEQARWQEIWPNLPGILSVSCLLFAVVVWKVRQADR